MARTTRPTPRPRARRRPSPPLPRARAKVLTAAELKTALVTKDDLATHKFTEPTKADRPTDYSADKAECAPIADLLSTGEISKPGAAAATKSAELPKEQSTAPEDFDIEKAFDLPLTMVTLGSYEGQGAQDAFAATVAAGTACAGGFELTQDGEKVKVVKVETTKVTGGDEAAGWAVTMEADGTQMVFKTAAVRQGATLATFSTLNMSAVMTGKDFDVPVALIDAQAKKLAQQG